MCPSLKWNRGKLRCTRLLPFTYSSFHWSYCYHSFGNYCHRSSVCRKENIFFGHIIQYLAYQVCSIPKVNAVIVFYTVIITAWKVSKYGVISGPYFSVLYADWIQENADQKLLRIWTLFTQWMWYKSYTLSESDFFVNTGSLLQKKISAS